jgi:hypothetical protein
MRIWIPNPGPDPLTQMRPDLAQRIGKIAIGIERMLN